MIDRDELRRLHSEDLPLHVLEQDYIQAIFLSELYSRAESLVFKGGTFLKHAHGLDRFSEDLDFTAVEEGFKEAIEDSAKAMADYGIGAETDSHREGDVSFSCRMMFQGPLYQGSKKSEGRIEIDVSKREDVLLEPEWVRMFFEYPETRVVNALGLQEKELMAEKLRALATRDKARDLYDCWFMLKQGMEIDRELFDRKMDVVDEDTVLNVDIDEGQWGSELGQVLENPPDLSKVKEELLEKVQESGIQVVNSQH